MCTAAAHARGARQRRANQGPGQGRRLAQAAQRVAGEPRGEAPGSSDAVDGGGGEIRGPRIRPVTAGAEETPKTHAARLENLTS